MSKQLLIFSFFSLLILSSFEPVEDSSFNYIDTYKDLAVVEMHRSGIPASIKLAQGLLESNSGKSALAVRANNHFGIKCKRYWTGQTYYHKDDDFDKAGRLVESCFRAYNDPIDSFVDHSNFLTNTKHYGELFNYDRTDYRSWAIGLKKCGYATDPSYANKLIRKIEQYKLYRYDYVQLTN